MSAGAFLALQGLLGSPAQLQYSFCELYFNIYISDLKEEFYDFVHRLRAELGSEFGVKCLMRTVNNKAEARIVRLELAIFTTYM